VPVLVSTGERRLPTGDASTARPAAVLVLIAPDAAGEARVVLIERGSYEGHHSGEIAFPGGSAEAIDTDAAATALREAAEEIGLRPDELGVRVVGNLEPFWIPVSNYRVTPVVAIADRLAAWTVDAREVARVIEVPLEAFLPGAPTVSLTRVIGDWTIRYGAFPLDDVPGDVAIWGATARILGQLGAVIGPP
jgi:8-oxo-dGTP pyrophosphatase MutT (NUDIX family)